MDPTRSSTSKPWDSRISTATGWMFSSSSTFTVDQPRRESYVVPNRRRSVERRTSFGGRCGESEPVGVPSGMMRAMGPRRVFASVVTAVLVLPLLSLIAPPGSAALVTTRPAKAAVGAWQVRSLGANRYLVAWTSPTRFPLTSDRPTVVGPTDLA